VGVLCARARERERERERESSLDAPKYALCVERALGEWRRRRAERDRDDLGRECAGGKGRSTRGDGEKRERRSRLNYGSRLKHPDSNRSHISHYLTPLFSFLRPHLARSSFLPFPGHPIVLHLPLSPFPLSLSLPFPVAARAISYELRWKGW